MLVLVLVFGMSLAGVIPLPATGQATGAGARAKAPRIPLKVLYVGYSPEKPMPEKGVYYMTSDSLYPKIYRERMNDFRSFLEKNFTIVQTVDVRDYTAKMSDQADVTIMDAGPVKLPEGFDRPMILMAAMAPNVGLPIGLKFDWYCQCLEGDALHIRMQHEIFNTPNKVRLTLVERPTPGSFFNGFQGLKMTPTLPMWRVLTRGYSFGTPYLIGMVSHGEGFDDSPDAEAISGGVCLKNAEAVALGRQGNYFMWGFSGSPDYMTDEARKVFVNAICYIRKFDHQAPIVKKVQIETREGLDEKIYRIDESVYQKAIVSRKEGNARLKGMQDSLRARKAAGHDIGWNNEMFLKMPMTDAVESFEDYIKGYAGPELFARYGTDTKAYHKYYRDNYEYFYPLDAYNLQLDQDAQHLGLSNRRAEILDKCIGMLERGEEPELARRVLERYTTERFATAVEWREWLAKNRSRLFYTEAGGFKFMVNTYKVPSVIAGEGTAGAGVPASEVMTGDGASPATGQAVPPTAADPVAVSARLEAGPGKDKKVLVIDADILKGWHIYAYVSRESPFIQTEMLLDLPEGATSDKDWQSTAGVPLPGSDGIFVYEGKVRFKVMVDCSRVKPGTAIKCGLYYQVCDNTKCFPPRRKTLDVEIDQGADRLAQKMPVGLAVPGQAVSGQDSSGQAVPDFTLKTPAGDDFRLSSLRGQWVILDFWASWCMPCRALIPHLKEVYTRYHTDGLEVVSVSADANHDAWKKAMGQERMPWKQVVDTYLGGESFSDVATNYGIGSVPYLILLDKQGKTIALNPDPQVMDRRLREIFGH